MTTNYPASLDSYSTKTDNVDNVMAAHINDPQDAIEAIEAKVGVDGSAVATAFDYFLKHASGAYRTHKHDGTSDDGAKLPKIDPAQSWGKNLIRNSPGQIVTDGAEPQWWDKYAATTATDEDTVGEGIADIHERCFKVITTSDTGGAYQILLFADEELLDAGQTVVSLGCPVYCASANKAYIEIYGSNLGSQQSTKHTGSGTWEWLTVENITVHAADTQIIVRLRVDTGTAYFTMPMLTVGPEAQAWMPRDEHYVPLARVTHLDLNTTGDVAWSDTDCTANTDNLCVGIQISGFQIADAGDLGAEFDIGHSDTVTGGDEWVIRVKAQTTQALSIAAGRAVCDDSQVIRYKIEEIDADNDLRCIISIQGYWMWE